MKTTNEPAPSRNNGSRSAFSKNNDSSPASERNDGNGEVDEFGGDDVEHAKKSRKSKGQKLAKSQKLFKSGKSKVEKLKKPPKSGNRPNFNAKNTGSSFLTPKARSAFNHIWLAFTKALILRYFDLKCHIRIKTDASSYIISDVLSQLASGTSPDRVVTKIDFSQWHPVNFFLRKMVLAKTRYKTHDNELLTIVEAFKMWRHYLKGYKYEILIFTDYNNLRCFMDTKSLSSK